MRCRAGSKGLEQLPLLPATYLDHGEVSDMDMQSIWQQRFEGSMEESVARIKRVPGVVLGFHSTIDGLKKVTPELLDSLLASDPELAEEARARTQDLPIEINTRADLLGGLLSSMQRGKALQLMIRKQEVFDWFMDACGYDELRLGGTSGNMANYLSPLGFKKILVYANPLTKQQAELFAGNSNLNVLTQEDGHYELKHPHQAWQGEGIHALHWILEYPAGLKARVGDLEVSTPRANRYIAAWNPANNQLQVTNTFRQGLLEKAGEFSHFIVSGFHILSERYPDGSTYADCLKPVAEYLSRLREKAPHLKLHYEFASIASCKIRAGIIDLMLPAVHSLGLNEVELCAILRDTGDEESARAIESGAGLERTLSGLCELSRRTGLDRIQLHDLGYYLCITRKSFIDPVVTSKGLMLAATLAASRSLTGNLENLDVIFRGLQVPFSPVGLAGLRTLSHVVGDSAFEGTGIGTYGDWDVVYIPTKVVENPVLTVALGDIISSSAFVVGT